MDLSGLAVQFTCLFHMFFLDPACLSVCVYAHKCKIKVQINVHMLVAFFHCL